MVSDTGHGGTDLGRRIQEHRGKAGLTRAETAERAGMAASYLAYLETNPDAARPLPPWPGWRLRWTPPRTRSPAPGWTCPLAGSRPASGPSSPR